MSTNEAVTVATWGTSKLVNPLPFPVKEPLNEPDTPVESVKSTKDCDTSKEPVITASPSNGKVPPPPPPVDEIVTSPVDWSILTLVPAIIEVTPVLGAKEAVKA